MWESPVCGKRSVLLGNLHPSLDPNPATPDFTAAMRHLGTENKHSDTENNTLFQAWQIHRGLLSCACPCELAQLCQEPVDGGQAGNLPLTPKLLMQSHTWEQEHRF